jgi:GNAT superfamily N-acetyltransferase
MSIADDRGRAGGRLLLDGAGKPLVRFTAVERDGRQTADLLELEDGVSLEAAARAIRTDLAGWRVAVGVDVGEVLIATGAQPRRDVHVMSRGLVRDPPDPGWLEPGAPAGLRLAPADRPAVDLAPACAAAYPPDHPDFAHMPRPERPEISLEALLSGQEMGPLLRASGLAVDAEGAVVGAILVCATGGEPPLGGPWVAQIFRDPHARGAGGALLRRALGIAGRDGLPALGLAVTHGNRARSLYAAHGFTEVLRSITVEVPQA